MGESRNKCKFFYRKTSSAVCWHLLFAKLCLPEFLAVTCFILARNQNVTEEAEIHPQAMFLPSASVL
jgi:hypothetical protein